MQQVLGTTISSFRVLFTQRFLGYSRTLGQYLVVNQKSTYARVGPHTSVRVLFASKCSHGPHMSIRPESPKFSK